MQATSRHTQLVQGAAAFAIKYLGNNGTISRGDWMANGYQVVDRDKFDIADRNHDGKLDADELALRLDSQCDGALEEMQGKDAAQIMGGMPGSIADVTRKILTALGRTTVQEDMQIMRGPTDRVKPVDAGVTQNNDLLLSVGPLVITPVDGGPLAIARAKADAQAKAGQNNWAAAAPGLDSGTRARLGRDLADSGALETLLVKTDAGAVLRVGSIGFSTETGSKPANGESLTLVDGNGKELHGQVIFAAYVHAPAPATTAVANPTVVYESGYDDRPSRSRDSGVVYTESYRDERQRAIDTVNAGRAIGGFFSSVANGILR